MNDVLGKENKRALYLSDCQECPAVQTPRETSAKQNKHQHFKVTPS